MYVTLTFGFTLQSPALVWPDWPALVLKTKLSKTGFILKRSQSMLLETFSSDLPGLQSFASCSCFFFLLSIKWDRRSETFSSCQCHYWFVSQEAGCTEDTLLEPIVRGREGATSRDNYLVFWFHKCKMYLSLSTSRFCLLPLGSGFFFSQNTKSGIKVFWEIWQILAIVIMKQIIYLLSGHGRSNISPLNQTLIKLHSDFKQATLTLFHVASSLTSSSQPD